MSLRFVIGDDRNNYKIFHGDEGTYAIPREEVVRSKKEGFVAFSVDARYNTREAIAIDSEPISDPRILEDARQVCYVNRKGTVVF